MSSDLNVLEILQLCFNISDFFFFLLNNYTLTRHRTYEVEFMATKNVLKQLGSFNI